MAKKTRRKNKPKKSKSQTKGNSRFSKLVPKSRSSKIALGVILIVVAVLIGGFALFSVLTPPSAGGSGYMEITLIDSWTGDEIDGEVVLTQYNKSDKKYDFPEDSGYDNPIETGEVFYIDSPVFITVWDIDSDDLDGRTFLPKTISPLGSEDINDPYENTIVVHFLRNPNYVECNITELDGVEGIYNESDISGDIEYDIELWINITTIEGEDASLYGSSSYVPEYYLEKNDLDDTLEYEIGGFGLWLVFNGTEVIHADVENIEPSYTYIEDLNISMILLEPVFLNPDKDSYISEAKIDVEFECKTDPIEIFIFEGFLEDLEDNKILITG